MKINTICTNCKHSYVKSKYMYGRFYNIYYCDLFDKKKINYVTGEEDIVKRKRCKKINKKGNCQLYEKKETDGKDSI